MEGAEFGLIVIGLIVLLVVVGMGSLIIDSFIKKPEDISPQKSKSVSYTYDENYAVIINDDD